MKHEKYSQNIYVYQLKYLNDWNLIKKSFQALKSDLQIYKLHKVFAGLTDFPKVLDESHKLCEVVRSFHKLHKSCLWVPQTL